MTDLTGTPQAGVAARLRAILSERRGLVRDYLAAISGSAGRLVFSLIYFLALANGLSLGDFGLFATASAAGIMLSRLLAFGFIAPLYRTATVRPRLIGVYTGGFILLGVASLPLIALAALATWTLFFAATLPLGVFAAIVASEVLLGRPGEAVTIVNNGMGRFGRGSFLTIFAVVCRTVAAVAFILTATSDLATWTWYYLAGNSLGLIVAATFFYPRQRIRFVPKLYWRRLSDALSVAGSEVLFYLQSELDKFVVLAFGGAQLAGLYAIIMRLVELTAIPIRTFNMMLVQKMMRMPQLLAKLKTRVTIEVAIMAVSTAGISCLALILHFYPTLLGRNISEAAPLVMLVLLIPGFRNLVEYHAEILFARGQTFVRAINLAILTAVKGGALAAVLMATTQPKPLIIALTGVFGLLYLTSAVLTYPALNRPVRRV